MIIFCGEVFNGSRLLGWCVEQFSIHTRSAFAGIFGDASYGETSRAVRASENELQGADFALLTLLLRLHDSSLQTTHVAVGALPIDGVPVNRWTQARAGSFVDYLKFSTNS